MSPKTPEEFVKAFYDLKEEYKSEIFNSNDECCSAELFKKLNLNKEQTKIFKEFVDVAFTDLLYSILFCFEGSSSFSKSSDQQQFEIFNEEGIQICGGEKFGEIEGLAYEYFYEKN